MVAAPTRRAIGCLGMKVAVEEKLRRSNKREANDEQDCSLSHLIF